MRELSEKYAVCMRMKRIYDTGDILLREICRSENLHANLLKLAWESYM